MTAYLREMEHARRDLSELVALVHLAGPVELTDAELAQAIGLAHTAHRTLLGAMRARHVRDAPAPLTITSRRGRMLRGRIP